MILSKFFIYVKRLKTRNNQNKKYEKKCYRHKGLYPGGNELLQLTQLVKGQKKLDQGSLEGIVT